MAAFLLTIAALFNKTVGYKDAGTQTHLLFAEQLVRPTDHATPQRQPLMEPQDISSDINRLLAEILGRLRDTQPALTAYLNGSDVRPPIEAELLTVLHNSLALCDMLEKNSRGSQFRYEIRNSEAPLERDYYPWICEKLGCLRNAAKHLVGSYLTPLHEVTLLADAHMSPAEWLHDYIVSEHSSASHYALTVFEKVLRDRLSIVKSLVPSE